MTQRLTKRELRILKQQGVLNEENHIGKNFQLRSIKPKTNNQAKVIDYYDQGKHLLLHGVAGTGKTFMGLYLALGDVLEERYKRVVIVRSVVPTRDIGFLPGKLEQKIEIYEAPYKAIANDLFRRGDAYEILKKKDMLQFLTTSFVRGITLSDCVVVVDEINNMTFHELDSVITRLGQNTKIIFCGDFRQTDLRFADEQVGLEKFMKVLNRMDSVAHVEFDMNDIVRSGFVKEYIIQKTNLNYV